MPCTRLAVIAPAAIALFAASPALAAPNVVATVKPLHSLVAAVMDGVCSPELLVHGAASPHGFSLRPSDAAKLESADVVFWIGEDLETFLPGPLASLAGNANVVEMMDVEGMTILEMREGGLFEAHSHDHEPEHDHGHNRDEHDHGHDDHEDDHDHHDHEHDSHTHEHDHAHGDGHIWLDPQNARLMVAAIADTLIVADPENAAAYDANGRAVVARLAELEAEIDAALEPARGQPFFVFHDAYHYFEARFGIEATGSFTVNPEIAPGAARLTEIQETVNENEAACLFSEPQFSPAIISTIAEGTSAKIGVLDPLGADIEDGPELYFTLLRNLAASLSACLA